MNMATMQMYCPSLKKNVEATITDGKRVASKGGSLRNILYGEFEGKKCLPKTVKAEVFAQHGFAAESEGESATYEPSQEPEGSEPATEPTNANFEAYDDPISDRQEYKITSLGGTIDSSMNRSEASDYIKKLQGRKSGTWKEAESSPSSFDISWEDGQGVSSPSLPPEGIHFAEQGKNIKFCNGCNKRTNFEDTGMGMECNFCGFPEADLTFGAEDGECEVCFEKNDGTGNLTQCNRCDKQICLGDMDACSSICGECGTYCCDDCLFSNNTCANCNFEYRAEGDYHMNGESCEYCSEARELNAEGFCSECSRHAESFSSSSYENAFFTETVSEMAAEGISRNGKLALSLTALGIGVAMALGSDKVSSLLDKFNRK